VTSVTERHRLKRERTNNIRLDRTWCRSETKTLSKKRPYRGHSISHRTLAQDNPQWPHDLWGQRTRSVHEVNWIWWVYEAVSGRDQNRFDSRMEDCSDTPWSLCINRLPDVLAKRGSLDARHWLDDVTWHAQGMTSLSTVMSSVYASVHSNCPLNCIVYLSMRWSTRKFDTFFHNVIYV